MARCPICKKPSQVPYKPFCSRRCADVDLGRWLGEGYVLPGDAPLEGVDNEPGSSPAPDRAAANDDDWGDWEDR